MIPNKLRMYSTHLFEYQIDALKKISQSRQVAQSNLVRQAIDNFTDKYLEEGQNNETNKRL